MNKPVVNAVFARVASPYYAVLVAMFVAIMLVSNITASKGVEIFGLVTDGAFFLFPLSYVLGDVISEVYGFKAMRRAIGVGFFALVLASITFWIAIELPAADFYAELGRQEAFEATLSVVPQLVLAGLGGYLVGEFLNSLVLVKLKERAGERHLWVRLLGSTVVGQFFDTLVFCSIAATAIGISTGGQFINFVITGFVWKTAVEVVVMPLTYLAVAKLKQAEPTYQEALAAAAETESPGS